MDDNGNDNGNDWWWTSKRKLIEQQVCKKMQTELIQYKVSFDEWALRTDIEELTGNIAITLARKVANLDQQYERCEHFEVRWIPRTTYKRTVWNQIKVSWLDRFIHRWGLTAPFWQPELYHYEESVRVPVVIDKVIVNKVVAPLGTKDVCYKTITGVTDE